MLKHLKYLRYVLRHKLYVYREGRLVPALALAMLSVLLLGGLTP